MRSMCNGTWSEGLSQVRTSRWIGEAGQAVGGLRREQGVVDADAVVPLPGAGLVVPEGVGAGRAVGCEIGVGQAQATQGPEAPRLRLERASPVPVGRELGVPRGSGMTLKSPVSTSGSSRQRQVRAWAVSRPIQPSL